MYVTTIRIHNVCNEKTQSEEDLPKKKDKLFDIETENKKNTREHRISHTAGQQIARRPACITDHPRSACIADQLEQKMMVARLHRFACRNEAHRRRYLIILLFIATYTHSEVLHHFALTLHRREYRSGHQSSFMKPAQKMKLQLKEIRQEST